MRCTFIFLLFTFFSLEAKDLPPAKVNISYPVEKSLHRLIKAKAKLQAYQVVTLHSELGGTLDKLHYQEGQKVEKGSLIAEIINPSHREDFKIKQARLTQSLLNFQKAQELFKHQATSANQLKELEAKWIIDEAEKNKAAHLLEKGRIIAPFTGYIGALSLQVGTYIPPSSSLMRFQNHEKLIASFFILDSQVSQIEVGKRFSFFPSSIEAKPFEGKIQYVDNQVEPQSPFVLVKGHIENPDLKLLPHMRGEVHIPVSIKENAILIPQRALFSEGENHYFYYVEKEHAHKFSPELGLQEDEWIEVLNWTDTSKPLIIDGKFKIWADGQEVEILHEGSKE